MGLFLKSRISESEAARFFLRDLTESIESGWPRIAEKMRPALEGRSSALERERMAKLRVAAAVTAAHLEQLSALFAPDRAAAIAHQTVVGLARQATGTHLESWIETYREAWRSGQADGPDPIAAVAARLCEDLLGRRPGSCAGAEDDDCLRRLTHILGAFDFSWWKHLAWRYRIR